MDLEITFIVLNCEGFETITTRPTVHSHQRLLRLVLNCAFSIHEFGYRQNLFRAKINEKFV